MVRQPKVNLGQPKVNLQKMKNLAKGKSSVSPKVSLDEIFVT